MEIVGKIGDRRIVKKAIPKNGKVLTSQTVVIKTRGDNSYIALQELVSRSYYDFDEPPFYWREISSYLQEEWESFPEETRKNRLTNCCDKC